MTSEDKKVKSELVEPGMDDEDETEANHQAYRQKEYYTKIEEILRLEYD